MKHIKKKYLYEVESSSLEKAGELCSLKEISKVPSDKDLYLIYSGGSAFKSFIHKTNGGTKLMIPIPDISLVYFDGAYSLNSFRKEQEKKLIEKAEIKETVSNGDEMIHEIYNYYGFASNCLISLFTSLESYINRLLPDDKNYLVKNNKSSELFDKEQIQKHITFNDKVKKVLPQFFGINFYEKQTSYNQHLDNLKNLRDDIVHPKSGNEEILIKKVINFKYDATFEAVAAFMNFYTKDYCKECECANDF